MSTDTVVRSLTPMRNRPEPGVGSAWWLLQPRPAAGDSARTWPVQPPLCGLHRLLDSGHVRHQWSADSLACPIGLGES